MKGWMVVAAALLLAAGAGGARADSCETYPGSQVYTDQCGSNALSQKPAAAASPAQPSELDQLRDRLRRILSGSGAKSAAKPTAEQINQRVNDARTRIDSALADPNAPGAHARYDAAMKDLHAAYGDAAQTFPGKADIFQRMEQNDGQTAASKASGVTWADAAPAPAETPKGPDNVTAQGSNVYVCDGAVAGGNVSCREISASGQCTGVTLADGEVGWRDSISTDCHGGDMDQRQAFLAANPDAANAVANADPAFTMDAPGTEAEIKRLTADPELDRKVDDGDKKDWDQATADPAAPTVDKAYKVTPIDPSTVTRSNGGGGGGGGSDLDDAIDTMNALSSILGAMGSMSPRVATPTVSAPLVRTPTPTVRVPSVPVYRPTVPTGGSDITGTR